MKECCRKAGLKALEEACTIVCGHCGDNNWDIIDSSAGRTQVWIHKLKEHPKVTTICEAQGIRKWLFFLSGAR